MKSTGVIYKVGDNIFSVKDKFIFTATSITAPSTCIDVKADHASDRLFVLDLGSGNLIITKLSDGSGIYTVTGFSTPWQLFLDLANNKIFVSDSTGYWCLNATTYAVITHIAGINATGLAIDLATNRIFLGGNANFIYVYNYATNAFISSFSISESICTGLFFDTANNRLLFFNGSYLKVIDGASLSPVQTVSGPGAMRSGAACYPLNTLYVCDGSQAQSILIYNLATLSLLQIVTKPYTANDFILPTNQIVQTSYGNPKLMFISSTPV